MDSNDFLRKANYWRILNNKFESIQTHIPVFHANSPESLNYLQSNKQRKCVRLRVCARTFSFVYTNPLCKAVVKVCKASRTSNLSIYFKHVEAF